MKVTSLNTKRAQKISEEGKALCDAVVNGPAPELTEEKFDQAVDAWIRKYEHQKQIESEA